MASRPDCRETDHFEWETSRRSVIDIHKFKLGHGPPERLLTLDDLPSCPVRPAHKETQLIELIALHRTDIHAGSLGQAVHLFKARSPQGVQRDAQFTRPLALGPVIRQVQPSGGRNIAANSARLSACDNPVPMYARERRMAAGSIDQCIRHCLLRHNAEWS